MCEDPAWIKIHWNSIWLRAQSHMTSHYTWGSVTTLHDFGGDLRRPLNTFFWALTISWSRLLARVWSDPQVVRKRTSQAFTGSRLGLKPWLRGTNPEVISTAYHFWSRLLAKGHFTHKTEDPWPLQSKSFHSSKGRRPSKFTSDNLKAQRRPHGWKVYMVSYIANYG